MKKVIFSLGMWMDEWMWIKTGLRDSLTQFINVILLNGIYFFENSSEFIW
jgi:hypothetical protein